MVVDSAIWGLKASTFLIYIPKVFWNAECPAKTGANHIPDSCDSGFKRSHPMQKAGRYSLPVARRIFNFREIVCFHRGRGAAWVSDCGQTSTTEGPL